MTKTATYELLDAVETLKIKLGIWETRAEYATGARKTECLAAVADLRAKIEQTGGSDG